MSKLSKEFFQENEVLFLGYSSKNEGFSKMVYNAFLKNGIKVYPVNKKEGGSYEVKVYKSLEDLPKIPKTAYVLLNKENTRMVIKDLINKGITKILFQNKKSVDNSIIEECARVGIETAVACPMMKFGSGIHRIHGFFAGVK